MERIPALIQQVSDLASSVGRLEDIIRQEIKDLKDEQIKDLKEQNTRLADDQRRLWETVRSLENRDHQFLGGSRVIQGLFVFIGMLAGSLITAVASKFIR